MSNEPAESQVMFISDLHLCKSRPEITAQFIEFTHHIKPETQALYILGDFFEYWAGDDDIEHIEHQPIITALTQLAQRMPVYFMHGNRDFLLGKLFEQRTEMRLLPDLTIIEWFGYRLLLSHGDALCTDDVDYQNFRQQVRQSYWQATFLQQPLAERKAQIEAIRKTSEQEKSHKSAMIMDVNPEAVKRLLVQYDWPDYLIHGHTHRPNIHDVVEGKHHTKRCVLGDWYEQGSCLVLSRHGVQSYAI